MKYQQVILGIDDELKILELVKAYLEMNGYRAFCAQNGREGMDFFRENPVSLILLDLMLPDFSGEDFCGKIREVSNVPIIMLTAKVDEASIIRGLGMGADDYVTKPFSPRQLMARVQAALRRAGGRAEKRPLLTYRDLTVNTEKRQVRRNGEEIVLTRDEYNILALLMSRPAKTFTRDEILDAIKGDEYEGFDRSIDSHIKRLRAKIGDDFKTPTYIATVYGMGYRFGTDQ